jgi:hypothetical protein
VDEFPILITKTAHSLAGEDLFAEGKGPLMDAKSAKIFHTWVAKALFARKRARPHIHVPVTLLCTRVKSPNESN